MHFAAKPSLKLPVVFAEIPIPVWPDLLPAPVQPGFCGGKSAAETFYGFVLQNLST
jgi:hypothetical protein